MSLICVINLSHSTFTVPRYLIYDFGIYPEACSGSEVRNCESDRGNMYGMTHI